jgi:hypothetical protein
MIFKYICQKIMHDFIHNIGFFEKRQFFSENIFLNPDIGPRSPCSKQISYNFRLSVADDERIRRFGLDRDQLLRSDVTRILGFQDCRSDVTRVSGFRLRLQDGRRQGLSAGQRKKNINK